ncbi:hypothetical protein [Streptomyces sp. NPDC058548]|uniref:hypothetical protein n=1 Tax=Streptomyces sp. NPDC058548 TaxID=3346545 RepID=UPI00364783A2
MGLQDPINVLGESGIDVLVCGTRPTLRCPAPETLHTPGRPPLTVVLDPGDDARVTHAALAAHDPAAGRFVVHPTVAPHGRLVWQDILTALGRDTSRALGRGAWSMTEQERAVLTALRRLPPRQLTLLRAHRMGTGLWADLVHLHRSTAADLVLVHHAELDEGLAHLLRHCDHRIVGYTEMLVGVLADVQSEVRPNVQSAIGEDKRSTNGSCCSTMRGKGRRRGAR